MAKQSKKSKRKAPPPRKLRDVAKAKVRALRRWAYGLLARRAPMIQSGSLVYAGVATMPERRDALQKAVASLHPQVDRIFVFLNGYDSVPEFLVDPKIEVFRSQDHGNLGPAGKFFGVTRVKSGIYFCADDDILYPENYVAKMRSVVRACNDKAVVGVHGAYYPSRPKAYFDRTLWHYRTQNLTRTPVSVLGTGTIAFPVPLVPIGLDAFKSADRADLWFALFLKEKSIPAVVVERRTNWLVDIEHDTQSLFDHAFADSRPHSQVVFEAQPWGVEDLLRRAAGLEAGLSPAWQAFVRFYDDLQKGGPAAAATHLTRRRETAASTPELTGPDRAQFHELVDSYCDEAEKFSLFAALSDIDSYGSAFELLGESSAGHDPERAAGLFRRASEAAVARGDAAQAVSFAQRASALLRQCGKLDDAAALQEAPAPPGGSNGLIKEAVHLDLARQDYAGMLEKLIEHNVYLSESEWFPYWLGIATYELYGAEYALSSFARTSTRGGRMTALAVHCQNSNVAPPRFFPAPEMRCVEPRLQDVRECEPWLKLYIGLGQRAAAAELFARYEANLRDELDPAAVGALCAACQADPAATLDALNQVFATYGMRPLRSQPAHGGCAFSALRGEAGAAIASGPLVSVIVTASNAEATIEHSLHSLTEQSHRNLQILVVDHASTDATRCILERLAAADPRIAVIGSHEDAADYSGRNIGLAAATGDYVTFHRAGDFAHPQRIEMQLRAIDGPHVVACYARSVRLNAAGLVVLNNSGALIADDTESLMWRASVTSELGGFCRTKWRGDIEFRDRIISHYGDHAMHPLKQLLQLTLHVSQDPSTVAAAARQTKALAAAYRRKHWLARGQREALYEPL